jgi:hypothetical protein
MEYGVWTMDRHLASTFHFVIGVVCEEEDPKTEKGKRKARVRETGNAMKRHNTLHKHV